MFKFALLAISMSWCAAAASADEPQWLKDARAREAKPLDATEIVSKDGWFKARVPAKLVNAIEKVEGSYTIEFSVDAAASVYCEVYPEGLDLANLLRASFDNSMRQAEAGQGKVEASTIETLDAGAHGAVPFITTAWIYRARGADKEARVGALKQFVMEKNGYGVYCAHNDIGYTQTFATLTKALADSIETKDAVIAPHYVEILTVRLPDREIGIAAVTLERDSEGDVRAREMTAMLLPSPDGSTLAQDSTHIAWLRPDGSIINASHGDVSNGEVESKLSLKADGDEWIVKGEVQGKTVSTKLPKDSEPGSWVAQARQLRALLAEPNPVGREHTIGIWLSENPGKLTSAKTKILARQGDAQFTALGDFGGLRANLTLDKATGTAAAADVKMGPLSIRLERVYVSGSF